MANNKVSLIQKQCSNNSTFVAESVRDSHSQELNSDSNSSDSVKSTNFAEVSSRSDSLELPDSRMSRNIPGNSTAADSKTNPTSSPLRRHASHFQLGENGVAPTTNGIASPRSSERSPVLNQNTSPSRTLEESCHARTDQENPENTLDSYSQSFPASGTMSNGLWQLAERLERPSLEKGCSWLPSPTALSSQRGRPKAGATVLESNMRQEGIIGQTEVANPEFLESCFGLPLGWTEPQENRSATELLRGMESSENDAPPLATVLTPELHESHFVESSTSIACRDKSIDIPSAKTPISFGKVLPQLLSGTKTVTRRAWKERHAKQFINCWQQGKRIPAFDKDRRAGGKQVGWLHLTQSPHKEKLSDMPASDLVREGFPELSKEKFIERFFNGDDSQFVWVLRFEFVPRTEFALDENSPDGLKSNGVKKRSPLEEPESKPNCRKRGRPKGSKNQKLPANGCFYCQNPRTNYHTYHYHYFADGKKRKTSVGVPPQKLQRAIAMKEQGYSVSQILDFIKG